MAKKPPIQLDKVRLTILPQELAEMNCAELADVRTRGVLVALPIDEYRRKEQKAYNDGIAKDQDERDIKNLRTTIEKQQTRIEVMRETLNSVLDRVCRTGGPHSFQEFFRRG